MRYGRRRDGNHGDVVNELRKIGCSVADTSAVGGGFGDLVVARIMPTGRRTVLFEVKDETGKNRLEESQAEFRKTWLGEYYVVRSPAEAVAIMLSLERSKSAQAAGMVPNGPRLR
jgi:hypothetical protein